MLQLYENIKALRIKKGMSQEELAIKTGYTSRSSIAKIETGEVDLSQSKIVAFAEALGTTPMQLMGWAEPSEEITYNMTKIPVYAPLCCGSGLFVDDEIIDYVAIPTESLQSNKEYFGQYAKGDSMIGAGINDGDILIFEKINGIISQGQIGCFCIDENIATCKKMMIAEDSTVYLMPANENYPPITITVENSCFRCIGKLAFVVSDRRGK